MLPDKCLPPPHLSARNQPPATTANTARPAGTYQRVIQVHEARIGACVLQQLLQPISLQ